MTSDIQRLIAEGSEITFADGSTARLRFGPRAMGKLEDRYGSLDAFLTEVGKTSGGKLYHLLAHTLHVALGLPEEKVWDLLDTRRAVEYVVAITDAMAEALPQPTAQESAGNGQGNAEAGPAVVSPGPASTTPPSSSGESIPTASGT